MTGDTVTIEVELPRETHDALAEHGSPASVLQRLAGEEARLLAAVERYTRRDAEDAPTQVPSRALGEAPPPVAVLLGFDTVEVEPDRAVVTMEAGPEHANPMGTLHGGVICDLGDAAMGIAFASGLDEGESFTTLELDAKYLKPVWEGELTATGSVVKRGSTVGLVECDVTDAEGSLVAHLQSVCLTLRGEQAAGR